MSEANLAGKQHSLLCEAVAPIFLKNLYILTALNNLHIPRVLSSKSFKKIIKISIALITGSMLTSLFLAAQTSPTIRYTAADGLTENRVMNIFEDSRGFLWLLSKNGITRFDGVEMIPYTVTDGLPALVPNSIYEDKNSTILVLTDRGLARYTGYSFEPLPLTPVDGVKELTENSCMDKDGSIFLHAKDSTGNNILLEFRDGKYEKLAIEDADFIKGNITQIIYSFEYEKIVLRMDEALYFIENNSLSKLVDNYDLEIRDINSRLYAVDYKDLYYRITDTGLVEIERSVFERAHGMPYASIKPMQAWIYLNNTEKNDSIKWPGAFITRPFRDSRGILWVATEDGLYRVLSQEITMFDNESGIAPDIWSVVEDNSGNLWFTSMKGAIQKYDGDKFWDMSALLPGNIRNFTLGSKKMSDGKIWFTSFSGILEWDGKRFSKLDIVDNQVECIYEDHDNATILLGYDKGLLVIRADTSFLFEEMTPSAKGYIRDISKIDGDNYLIVTHKSVFTFDGRSFVEVNGNPGLRINPVSSEKDSQGKVWIGTDRGLFVYDHTERSIAEAFNEEDNIPVRAILKLDSNRILVGRFSDFIIVNTANRDSEGNYKYTRYSKSDGFLSSGFIQNGMFRDSRGSFWLLGNERVMRFTPGIKHNKSFKPILYLTELETLNQSGEWVRKQRFSPYQMDSIPLIALDYTENNIRLHFISISNETGENIRYRYRVSGRKGSWSAPFKERSVIIPAIKPGKHTITIEAYNTTSADMKRVKDIHLNIRPAFWQTKIFIAGSALLLIILTYIISRAIIHRLNRKKREKTRLIREQYQLQMGNFIQQFDPHFTFNVLSSLSVMYRTKREEQADEYLIKFSNLLRNVITENAYTRSLGKEIKFIEDYCEMQKIKMGERLKFSVELEDKSLLDTIVPRMLIHNFVENSIKWGIGPRKEGGEIKIEISRNGGTRICILDNGIGRKEANKLQNSGTGKGMAITESLIMLLNENNSNKISLHIEDLLAANGSSGGTKVEITIPENFNYFNKD